MLTHLVTQPKLLWLLSPLQAEASFSDSATDPRKLAFFLRDELDAPLQMHISILL